MTLEEMAEAQRQRMLGRFRERHPSWKGGRTQHKGYIAIKMRGHPKASKQNGYVGEHILVAEKALGKHLPPKAEVHHIDHDRGNNDPSNLVVCEDAAYHMMLHRRERALRACGNPDWRICTYCHSYDAPERLTIFKKHAQHRECRNHYQQAYRAAKRVPGGT